MDGKRETEVEKKQERESRERESTPNFKFKSTVDLFMEKNASYNTAYCCIYFKYGYYMVLYSLLGITVEGMKLVCLLFCIQ